MDNQNENKISFNMLAILIIAIVVIGYLFYQSKSQEKVSGKKTSSSNTAASTGDNDKSNDGFLGDKGEEVKEEDGSIYIDESKVEDGDMHNFNFFSKEKDKNIYFFIVKASDGTYRAAANACEVCFGSRKGFKQVGDLIRCENCKVTYPKDKIAIEKGGCNPGPINKDVPIEKGKLMIDVSDIENIAYLF